MNYIISDKLRPPPHPFYGDSYERSLDPWHRDAAPPEFADRFPNQGKRKSGWSLLDAWENEIGFIEDGSIIEIDVRKFRELPKDLQDELMRQGAEVYKESLNERG